LKVVLYGTLSCHLCDQARALLHAARVTAVYIDIADDDELLERYVMRIPVVRRVDNGAELGWPFDEDALKRFLEQSNGR